MDKTKKHTRSRSGILRGRFSVSHDRQARREEQLLLAHEDSLSFGYGAELAARIAGELFEHLDAPVRRVCALDTFVGYAPQLEDAILPQPSDVAKAIAELRHY